MRKLIKIIIVAIFMIIMFFIVIVIFKVYHFIIISKVCNRIEEFVNQENRIYSEIIKNENSGVIDVAQIYRKDEQLKYLKMNINNKSIFFEIKNFDTGERYIFNNGHILDKNESFISSKEILFDIPNIIIANKKINIKELLKIYCIIPVEYNDKKCYEIITKSEVIIISKDTYLPEYMCKIVNSVKKGQDMKVEYFYKFEIGTVTDENMNLLYNLESN